jgi:hypothetical protein
VTFEPEQTPEFLLDASETNGLPGVLRFDGWCKTERIGFEHQGPQHDCPVAHHRVVGAGICDSEGAQAKFTKLRRYDQIRAAACVDEASLIVIPDISAKGYGYASAALIVDTIVATVREALPAERLDTAFEAAAKRLNALDADGWERMIQPIFAGSRVHRRLREHAEKLGGRVVKFLDDRRAELECADGHRWTAQINNVLSSTWCPVEARQSRARSRRLQIGTLRARLKVLGLQLDWSDPEARERYMNNQTAIPVTREACGGSFARPLAKLHAGSRCAQCKGKANCSGRTTTKGKLDKKLH